MFRDGSEQLVTLGGNPPRVPSADSRIPCRILVDGEPKRLQPFHLRSHTFAQQTPFLTPPTDRHIIENGIGRDAYTLVKRVFRLVANGRLAKLRQYGQGHIHCQRIQVFDNLPGVVRSIDREIESAAAVDVDQDAPPSATYVLVYRRPIRALTPSPHKESGGRTTFHNRGQGSGDERIIGDAPPPFRKGVRHIQ